HHPQRTPHRRPGLIQIRQQRRTRADRSADERIRNMRPEQHTNSRTSQQTGRGMRHTHHEKPPREKRGDNKRGKSRAPHPAAKTPPRAAQQQQRGGTNAAPRGKGCRAYLLLSLERKLVAVPLEPVDPPTNGALIPIQLPAGLTHRRLLRRVHVLHELLIVLRKVLKLHLCALRRQRLHIQRALEPERSRGGTTKPSLRGDLPRHLRTLITRGHSQE